MPTVMPFFGFSLEGSNVGFFKRKPDWICPKLAIAELHCHVEIRRGGLLRQRRGPVFLGGFSSPGDKGLQIPFLMVFEV